MNALTWRNRTMKQAWLTTGRSPHPVRRPKEGSKVMGGPKRVPKALAGERKPHTQRRNRNAPRHRMSHPQLQTPVLYRILKSTSEFHMPNANMRSSWEQGSIGRENCGMRIPQDPCTRWDKCGLESIQAREESSAGLQRQPVRLLKQKIFTPK